MHLGVLCHMPPLSGMGDDRGQGRLLFYADVVDGCWILPTCTQYYGKNGTSCWLGRGDVYMAAHKERRGLCDCRLYADNHLGAT